MNIDKFFSADYEFTGKHSNMVNDLTNAIVDDKTKFSRQIKIFSRNVDIILPAALLGFIYNRRSIKDSKPNINDKKVAGAQMIQIKESLQFVMQMIILLDAHFEPNSEKRLDAAFRFFGKDEKYLDRFEEYMRGGIEILHESIIKNDTSPFQITNNLLEFLDDFEQKFKYTKSKENVPKLCAAFKSLNNKTI